MLLSGLAGTGKTHLIVNELARAPDSIFPVVVFSPDRLKEFYPWLDEQVVTSLIKSDRLSYLSGLLTEVAFGRRIAKVRVQLEKDWGENPFRDFLDTVSAAARILIIQGVNVGAVLDSAIPIKKREQRLKKFATDMSVALRLGNQRGAVDFCAALLLCQTPYSEFAIQWLSHKSPPDDVKWNARSSAFCTFNCMAAALAALNMRVIICFDQLERVALDRNDGDTLALKQLIQESLKVLFEHANVGCIISALAAIVERTMPVLADADRDRLKDEPAPQELRQLPLSEAMDFFQPRLAYIAEQSPELAKQLETAIEWLAKNSEVRRVPPRLLLRSAKKYATQFLSEGYLSPSPPQEIWSEIVSQTSGEQPDPVISTQEEKDEAVHRVVEAEWQRVQSVGGFSALLPLKEGAVLELIAWAAETLMPCFSEIVSVGDVEIPKAASELSFCVAKRNGKSTLAKVYLANEPNHNKRLPNQLDALSNKKFAGRRIVFRTRDPFPAGRASPVRQRVDKLLSKGFECVDMTKEELITLLQLRRLEGSITESDMDLWLHKRLIALPALGKVLGV